MDFSHLHVEFFTDAVENPNASAAKGRPIFDEIEMIRIRIAGDPKSVLVAPALSASSVRDPATNQRLTYAQLHAEPYAAFKAGAEYKGSGTPIGELSFISRSKAEELKRLNIHTAEALAGLDGEKLQRLGMGARDLKDRAMAWISDAAEHADIARIHDENAALRSQMDALKAQLDKAPAGGDTQDPIVEHAESPFKDRAKEDIVNWIVANGGKTASPRLWSWSRDQTVRHFECFSQRPLRGRLNDDPVDHTSGVQSYRAGCAQLRRGLNRSRACRTDGAGQ